MPFANKMDSFNRIRNIESKSELFTTRSTRVVEHIETLFNYLVNNTASTAVYLHMHLLFHLTYVLYRLPMFIPYIHRHYITFRSNAEYGF